MDQLKNAADIANVKHEGDGYTMVWLFDQSSYHRKFHKTTASSQAYLLP
jgi:hypothetical protein